MATVASVLGDIESYLYSLGHFRDRVATLTAPLASSGATTLSVDEFGQVTKGLVEIGDELIYVKSADTSGNATIPAWGRGQQGTTAAAHSTGDRVRIHPNFPRSLMKRELTTAINNLFPDLWKTVVDNTAITILSNTDVYALPAAVESVISVSAQVKPGYAPVDLTRFKFDRDPNPTSFPTGRTLSLYSMPPVGTALTVVYRSSFTPFVAETDTLSSLGMNDRWADILRDMVAARLVLALEGSDIAAVTAQAQSRAAGTPFHAVNLSKYLNQVVAQRTAEERRKLMQENPSKIIKQY